MIKSDWQINAYYWEWVNLLCPAAWSFFHWWHGDTSHGSTYTLKTSFFPPIPVTCSWCRCKYSCSHGTQHLGSIFSNTDCWFISSKSVLLSIHWQSGTQNISWSPSCCIGFMMSSTHSESCAALTAVLAMAVHLTNMSANNNKKKNSLKE